MQAMFQTAPAIVQKGIGRELEGFHTITGVDPAALDLAKLSPQAADLAPTIARREGVLPYSSGSPFARR